MSEPEEEDFATMFEASERARRVEKGQIIKGTIVAIGAEVALIDVGGKSEASLDIDELKDDDGRLEVKVGDSIQAMVVSTAGELKLSRRLALGAASAQQLEDAFQSGLPVEGKVQRVVKGGYEVRIGRQRGFCPISQIDIVRYTAPAAAFAADAASTLSRRATADKSSPEQPGHQDPTSAAKAGHHGPTQHIGRVYKFRIIEYKDGGKNLVVSRRALLEEEQRAAAEEIRKSIAEGAIVTGRVVSVRDFGAFVDLGGGVQGLLHASEMGWTRVSNPREIVEVGDEITVKVLRIDDDKQKISLGLKQLMADPWSKVSATYQAGQLRTGRVTRVADFGAFVELEPGIEGLVPLSETGVGRDGDVKRAFPVGKLIDVVVLDVDANARRIRLSINEVQKLREADEVRDYTERADAEPTRGFGSLADKLRGALKPRQPRS